MRVLSTIAWPRDARERFFNAHEGKLPIVEPRPFDASTSRELIAEARQLVRGKDPINQWLGRGANALELTANMLETAGTRAFTRHAQALYGTPYDHFPGTEVSTLDLAKRLIATMGRTAKHLPAPPEPNLLAGQVAEEIRTAVRAQFGKSAPEVIVVPNLAARASAAPTRIRLRRGAKFSDLDVRQLIQHEAFIHVATALNGKRQKQIPFLSSNHAGTTRTQEGLAVFAELISGALDPRRLLRLAYRVIAVHMALDGADFIEVYRYFKPRSQNEVEAFESTVRVFRGGLVTGKGVAFTKDIVYLDGLCRVQVFVRTLVASGRVDIVPLLFAGKLDLEDLPAVAALQHQGLAKPARFLPPWVQDPRRLVAYFAVTNGVGMVASTGLQRHYRARLGEVPAMGAIPVTPRKKKKKKKPESGDNA